jgi:hypothetical protein
MSKVNDALKRVRDAQQSAPRTVQAAPLRPTIPVPAPAPAAGMRLMPIVFAVVVLFGLVSLILLWQVRHTKTAPVMTVKAAEAPSPAVQITSVAPPRPALPAVAAPKPASAPPTVAPIPTAITPPAPVIKLQGILYSGHNSSAMISGQTVTAGDEVGGYRVTAINQRSVTLVNANRTNVLTLGR